MIRHTGTVVLSLLSIIVAATAAATASAQGKCFYAPDNLRSGGNVIPFGSTKGAISTWGRQRYQALVLPADVNNLPINITSLAVGGGGTGIRRYASMMIRFDYFRGSGTALSTTFSNNMSKSPTTVLDVKDFAWYQVGGQWNRLGLQKPFQYIPQLGSLVVEVIVTGAYFEGSSGAGLYNTSLRPRLYNFRWPSSTPPATGTVGSTAAIRMQLCDGDPDLSRYGEGCVGSNKSTPELAVSGSASLGKKVILNLANVLATTPTFLALALTTFPVPVDLAIVNAPGCRIYHPQTILTTVVTTAAGGYSATFTTPTTAAAVGVAVYVQSFPRDPTANGLGLTASNYVRVLIGN
jgi:hypothetical protein